MAVILSEVQLARLKELTAQLQIVTSENSQIGAVVDEVMDILNNIEIDRDYKEAVTDGVMVTKDGAYIIG